MIDAQTTFRHHLFQIAIAERIPEIPPHTQHDHFILEMSSSECRWPVLSHSVYVTSLLRRLRHYRNRNTASRPRDTMRLATRFRRRLSVPCHVRSPFPVAHFREIIAVFFDVASMVDKL